MGYLTGLQRVSGGPSGVSGSFKRVSEGLRDVLGTPWAFQAASRSVLFFSYRRVVMVLPSRLRVHKSRRHFLPDSEKHKVLVCKVLKRFWKRYKCVTSAEGLWCRSECVLGGFLRHCMKCQKIFDGRRYVCVFEGFEGVLKEFLEVSEELRQASEAFSVVVDGLRCVM